MQFLIRAYDGEGKLDKRMEVRPRHLEGMKKLSAHIISAGGLLDDEGKMKGSALIMDFESRNELDDYRDAPDRTEYQTYNDQDSVRESVNAWISGLGYF